MLKLFFLQKINNKEKLYFFLKKYTVDNYYGKLVQLLVIRQIYKKKTNCGTCTKCSRVILSPVCVLNTMQLLLSFWYMCTVTCFEHAPLLQIIIQVSQKFYSSFLNLVALNSHTQYVFECSRLSMAHFYKLQYIRIFLF